FIGNKKNKKNKNKYPMDALFLLHESTYTQITSKVGFSTAPKHRNLPILSDLILLILGYLRSMNSESLRVAQNQLLK
ncbi:MAG: hypothetical protein KDK61_01160, partial [Simkania sp.]|nr:hypothetical protein [Simkania sp.]